MKAYWGSGRIAPLRLNGSEWSVSRSSRSTPRERTPVPMDQKTGWDLEPLWTFPRRKIPCPYWKSNQDYSVVLSVAGKLHQLRYPVFQLNSYEGNFISKIWRQEVSSKTVLIAESSMKANMWKHGPTEDRVQRFSFVNTAINFRLPCKAMSFCSNITNTGALRKSCITHLQCLRFETWYCTYFAMTLTEWCWQTVFGKINGPDKQRDGTINVLK